MYKITVAFTDTSVIECSAVRDTRRFWRMISKNCKYWGVRVVYVKKVVLS